MAYLARDTQGRVVVITDDWNGWFRPAQPDAAATQRIIDDRNYWRGRMKLPPELWITEDGKNQARFDFDQDRTKGLFGPDLGRTGTATVTAPVDLTEQAVDQVALAVVNEQADRLQN